MENKKVKPDEIVLFKNWTKEDFTGKWDGDPELFSAGEERWLAAWKANHYANHLIDQYLNSCAAVADMPEAIQKDDIAKACKRCNKVHKSTNHQSRQELMDRCIVQRQGVGTVKADKVEEELINKNKEAEVKKEGEFEDLKEDETPKQKRDKQAQK